MPPNQPPNISEPELPNNLPDSNQSPIVISPPTNPSQPTIDIPQISPKPQSNIGITGSQIAEEANKDNKKKLIFKIIFIVIGLILLAGVILTAIIIISGSSKLTSVSLTNGNYKYTFKYYRGATLIEPEQGSFGYKYLNLSTVTINPAKESSPANCNEIGNAWSNAFTVSLNGSQELVCTGITHNIQIFGMWFNSLNQNHFMFISYNINDKQNQSNYPTLKQIFDSVQVIQQ